MTPAARPLPGRLAKMLLAALSSLALLLALPAVAPGKTVIYKGTITRGVGDLSGLPGGGTVQFRVRFEGKPRLGKPRRVGFVQVHGPPWTCPKDYPSQPDATGHRLTENQRIRFGEWAPLGQGHLWTRVDRARQFALGTPLDFGTPPDTETADQPLFRSHYIDGIFRGKRARKASGLLYLEFGHPAPGPDDADYPGATDEYQCRVEHRWTARPRR